jgi:hypothetical protein
VKQGHVSWYKVALRPEISLPQPVQETERPFIEFKRYNKGAGHGGSIAAGRIRWLPRSTHSCALNRQLLVATFLSCLTCFLLRLLQTLFCRSFVNVALTVLARRLRGAVTLACLIFFVVVHLGLPWDV